MEAQQRLDFDKDRSRHNIHRFSMCSCTQAALCIILSRLYERLGRKIFYFKEENSSEVYLCFLIVGLLNGYLRDLCMVLW